MNNNIKITNLTQIHIGSGETLQKDTDFIVRGSGDNSDIYVIDPNKVGQIIGSDQKVLDQWIASIEKGDTNSFFDLYLRGAKPEDYSMRRIANFSGDYNGMTLKECIHDGMGRPYIPGSSLKGAIRTAIIAFIADKTPKSIKEKIIEALPDKREKRRYRYVDELGNKHNSAEDYFLGDTPNESLTRFIRVGDAFYNKNSEIAITQVSLNQRPSKQDLIDKRTKQPVEVIPTGEKSTFSLAIDTKRFNEVYSRRDEKKNERELKGMRSMPDECTTIPSLFHLLNEHTKRLVEYEIDYWENLLDYTGAEYYIDSMKEILEEINSCEEGECVLRVGQATGWRFITGAWTESLKDFDRKVVQNSRFHPERYEGFDFPKTRRIDNQSYLFGFVRLQESTDNQ